MLAASLVAPMLLALSTSSTTAGAATAAVFPVVQANATGVPPTGWSTAIRSAGSGMRKPKREFECSALELFFHVFFRLCWALIV